MFNSETIYYLKNSLMIMTPKLEKKLSEDYEKFSIIIKSNYPKAEPLLLLCNVKNKNNHDVTKVDIDLIQQMLLESITEDDNIIENELL